MKSARRNFLFIFFLVSGIIVGSLIARAVDGPGFWSWLAFGTTIGVGAVDPVVVDLSVMRLSFGFSLTVTIAHIICIGAAMLIYYTVKWR